MHDMGVNRNNYTEIITKSETALTAVFFCSQTETRRRRQRNKKYYARVTLQHQLAIIMSHQRIKPKYCIALAQKQIMFSHTKYNQLQKSVTKE